MAAARVARALKHNVRLDSHGCRTQEPEHSHVLHAAAQVLPWTASQ